MDMLAQPQPSYDWLLGESADIAPMLLGWELVTNINGHETAGWILETEAYGGNLDPASHAFSGPSARNATMFKSGGHIYTYLSYGIHTCLNIVTGPVGSGQAVLIRSLAPTRGLDVMSSRRGLNNPRLLTSGPGRLAQALGVTLSHDGELIGSNISLRPPKHNINPKDITSGPRVGITKASDFPWRFVVDPRLIWLG